MVILKVYKKQTESEPESRRKLPKPLKIVLILVAVLLLLVGLTYLALMIWTANCYRAVDVEAYLQSSDTVTVEVISEGYYFDGPGEDTALVFYPGGNVEATAYARMLRQLAEDGTDCFLVQMPYRLAFLGVNKADRILDAYDYSHWYIAGHSLGGVAASMYANRHPDRLEGLILLASYPATQMSSESLRVLQIYGENDGVCTTADIARMAKLLPPHSESYEIAGANHAGYGDYGAQKGDLEAAITPDEQKQITVEQIEILIEQQ